MTAQRESTVPTVRRANITIDSDRHIALRMVVYFQKRTEKKVALPIEKSQKGFPECECRELALGCWKPRPEDTATSQGGEGSGGSLRAPLREKALRGPGAIPVQQRLPSPGRARPFPGPCSAGSREPGHQPRAPQLPRGSRVRPPRPHPAQGCRSPLAFPVTVSGPVASDPSPSPGSRSRSAAPLGEGGAGGEGERRGASDQPETRSVCSSRSSSSGGGDQRAGHQHQHHQPICKICFQGAEQGELLNPCRCDGSVRYTHQLCLLKWISERGSWTCELCCYRYHVIAIKMKQPCQWQSISITLVEKVQMIAVILGSLFLIASMTWLLWSAFSPYAVWQRKDILFQICYGMYGFMDLVCIGLIVHEGAAVYRVFKRWRAVNLHWDVLNYDKATDIEESSRGESSTSRTLWLPLTALRNRNLVHPTQLTSPRFQCGYVLLHLFNRMRPHEDLSEDNSSGEVVMRVTSV
ncbi:E3 ubiquitin-protein ligase MARCH11 [Puma concolor]|uniref:RING-type E3 ubiquitin transferase n=2 Tax=Felinae TaxID=338152 RepID=A0A6P6HUU8_PUMCO|nr:E3 ubiquitin-protein ligase MARCH11 [Puma concolor]